MEEKSDSTKMKFIVTNNSENKEVHINFSEEKFFFLALIILGLILVTIVFLKSPIIDSNGVIINLSFLKTSSFIILFWLIIISIYYFLIKPVSITLIKNKNGNISVIKQGIFYIKKIYLFNKENNLSIIGKKEKISTKGLFIRIFKNPKYRMTLSYTVDGVLQEDIDLSLTINSFRIGSEIDKFIGFYDKEQLVEISNILDLPFIERRNDINL